MASSLTPEQRAKIELNRKIALEKRAARLAQISLSNSPVKLATANQNISSTSSNNQHIEPQQSDHFLNPSKNFYLNTNSSKPFNGSNANPSNTLGNMQPYTNTSFSSKNSSSSFYQKHFNSPKEHNLNYSSLNVNHVKLNKPGNNSNYLQKPAKSSCGLTNVQVQPQNCVNGTCKLVSKERFTVDMPYQQQAIDLFRTITGKEYDSNTRLWTFPVSQYLNLKKTLNVLRPHVVIQDLPKCIVQAFITKARASQQDISTVDISRVDAKLIDTIYPFQKDGIQFGVSKGGRCLVADDMGLGKSIQALGIADYYRSDWPLLVVCPSSMRYQWEEEIRVNLPNSVHTHQVFVMATGKDIVDGAKVLILSYDLLVRKKDLIEEMGFGVVILDESHFIKSNKTQRGKAALEVAKHCKRAILLSGTPVLSRPVELFTQIQAVDPSAFPYFKEYGMRYCDGKKTHFGWDFSGSSNMEELRILLEARFMIRRLKSNVLKQLPSKVRQVVLLNTKSSKITSDSMEAFALKLQSSTLRGSERHGTLLAYFAETSKTKSAAVCEYITDLLQDNRKFLCFGHHTDMLDAICCTLEKSKTYYIRIDGSVSAEDRKALCDKFQYEDKWMVAVLSIKAANTGLSLTAAQVVLFAELFWNPGDLVQAEDRVHRIGQEDCVIVKYLIAKGTADDYLWPLIQAKLEVLNKAGLSKDSFMTADTTCLKAPDKKSTIQTKIDDYFEEDNEELLKVMDEFEGVQEKKMKLEF